MDTDYLTEKAYKTILIADDVIEFLPSELGVLCSECKDEEDYLARAKDYIERTATSRTALGKLTPIDILRIPRTLA